MAEEANDKLNIMPLKKDRERVSKRQSGQHLKLIVCLRHVDIPDGEARLRRAIEILLKASAAEGTRSKETPPNEVVAENTSPHRAQKERHMRVSNALEHRLEAK